MGKEEHKLHKSNTNLHGKSNGELNKEISITVEEIMNKATQGPNTNLSRKGNPLTPKITPLYIGTNTYEKNPTNNP